MTEPAVFYPKPAKAATPLRHRLRFDATGVWLDGQRLDATQLHINASADESLVFAHITVIVDPDVDVALDQVRVISNETKRGDHDG